jgi:hypothetical protein
MTVEGGKVGTTACDRATTWSRLGGATPTPWFTLLSNRCRKKKGQRGKKGKLMENVRLAEERASATGAPTPSAMSAAYLDQLISFEAIEPAAWHSESWLFTVVPY